MKIFIQSKQLDIDQEYFEAIKSNNLNKLGEMVKNAAIAAGFTIGPLYHGTNKPFHKFKTLFGNMLWFTESRDKIEKGESGATGNSRIVQVYLKADRIGGWEEYEKEPEQRLMELFDAIKLEDDWVVFDPKRIKSAELITKIKGEIVPLSKRFGIETSDIRKASDDNKLIKLSNDRITRCYELSGRYVTEHIGENCILVHGKITNPMHNGKGFKTIDHAFVEIKSCIFDPVMNIKWPKDAYYRFFSVVENNRYTLNEVLEKTVESGTWGPW